MKLLIITQKVDERDAILGFFCRWILEFAKHCERVTVICLQKGKYHLPDNVNVLSLGKEKKISRPRYLINFYTYIWRERKNYDVVFVHMNQEYVLLGWKFWKLWNKKIFLWRNHAKGGWVTMLAIFFSDKVLCTSPQSFTARFKKTKIMPVGIDTDFFKPDFSIHKKSNSILFLGRIAPVKNVDIFIEALKELENRGVKFSATIAGSASGENAKYEKMIRDKVSAEGLNDKIKFTGAIPQSEALTLYREHELSVNLTPPGSMDKTIFEAMASGTLPIVSNISFQSVFPEWLVCKENNPKDLAEKIKYIINLHDQEKKDTRIMLRNIVVKNHELKVLVLSILKFRNDF